MLYATLSYSTGNLGDNIQSLAAERLLPSVEKHFDRDFLKSVTESEKHLLVMNGWFARHPEKSLPVADSILPLFFGFHVTNQYRSREYFLQPELIEFFKRHEPIGCRDKGTMKLLADKGVKTFYSKCLTLTFPRRTSEPKNGKVVLVETDHVMIPNALRKNAVSLSHCTYPIFGDRILRQMAHRLLDFYREEARLVVTTRLHCALPCIAMGIPVVFFGDPHDYRLEILKDLNLKIYRCPRSYLGKNSFRALNAVLKRLDMGGFTRHVDWSPPVLDIEEEKTAIVSRFKKSLDLALSHS